MRERKYVKFRVDMLSDTKSKIIDMRPERDLIHYVWMTLLLLAGKVNLEGDLYMSKNIPYTVETLAIEFNRGTYQVKLALDVLMELEMIELTENNVYRVKKFAKHQNIKIKEKNKNNHKEENIKNNKVDLKENSTNDIVINLEEVPVEAVVNENKVYLEVAVDEDIGEDTDDYFYKGNVDVEEDKICYFHDGDGEISLGEGESVVKAWAF